MRLFNSTIFTQQGAADDGWEPERAEVPVAAIIFELREAIYAFPNGSTRDEFRQWVGKMNENLQSALDRARDITDGNIDMGIRFVPWIIHRFKQLYAKYSSDSVSFDLRAILIFERVNCKHPLSNQPFRMCPDNKDFSLNLQWMSDLVDLWNTTRKGKGWPLLALDDAPYEGRFLGLPGSIVQLEDGKVPLDRPIWPEKEPVDDPVVGSQPIVTSADKGKRVDRSSASSLEVEKTKRERPLDVPISSSNCFGTDVIEITSSDELSCPPTPARRSTRSKTHSKDRVPHVVTAPQPKVRPRPRKRAKKDDALDIIPDVETLPTPPLPIASGSGAASSTTIDNDSSDDHEITVVFGNVILGGVRMTKEGVYLVPPDSERERNPCRLILNCGSTILWLGTILLPYIFWAHIPNDPNLDVLQQALFPCLVCLVFGFPCYHELGVAVGCIRCKVLKIHCPHSSRIESTSVPNPYNRLIARYMLSWQIYNLKKRRPLAVIYPNYRGHNFMPGVRRGYMPGHRNGNQKENAATISSRYTKISERLDWDEFWVGENYVEARRIWEKYREEPADMDFQNQINSRSPPIGTLLPLDIKDVLKEYYEEIRAVDPLFDLLKDKAVPPVSDDALVPPDDDDLTVPTDDVASSIDDITDPTDDATLSTADTAMPTDDATSPAVSSVLSSISPSTPSSAGSDTPKPTTRNTSTPSLNATPTPSTSIVPPTADVIPPLTVDAITVDTEMHSLGDAMTPPTNDVAMPMATDLLPTLTSDAVPSSDVNVALRLAPDAALTADSTMTTGVDSIPLPSVDLVTSLTITAVPPVAAEAVEFTKLNCNSISLSSYDAVAFSAPNTIAPTLTNTLPTANTATTPVVAHEPFASTDRAPPLVTQSADATELNVPPSVEEQDGMSNDAEKDNSEDAEGSLDDGGGDQESHGVSSTVDNMAENDVRMSEGHGSLSLTNDGLDMSMLIDEHFPTPSTSSSSLDVVMHGWQVPSPAQSSTHNLLSFGGVASGLQDRAHMTSPLLASHSNHASGPVFAHVDLPDPNTWKDNVTDRNLSLINGQLIDLQPGYPIGHQQPAPTPSISEGLTDTSSNPSPFHGFVPGLADELNDLRTMLCRALDRIDTAEAKQRETDAKLAATEQELIAYKAQIALLSSQAVNRNEDVLRQMKHRLDEETSIIRNTVVSSVGEAFRSFLQTHSHTSSSSPFGNDLNRHSISLPQQDSRRMHTHQMAPLGDTIFTSLLTDPASVVTSNPVSPVASHHPTNATDLVISNSTQGAGSSRLN